MLMENLSAILNWQKGTEMELLQKPWGLCHIWPKLSMELWKMQLGMDQKVCRNFFMGKLRHVMSSWWKYLHLSIWGFFFFFIPSLKWKVSLRILNCSQCRYWQLQSSASSALSFATFGNPRYCKYFFGFVGTIFFKYWSFMCQQNC